MKAKLVVVALAGILILLALPGVGNAQLSVCPPGVNTWLIPDGRIEGPCTLAASLSTFYNFLTSSAGRSYSVEVRTAVAGIAISVSTSPVTLTNTTGTAPAGFSGGLVSRGSFTTTGPGTVTITVTNTSTTAAITLLTVSVSETTLFNARWSTFSGFATQWGFQNTTNATINGVLTVNDSISGGPYTLSIAISPGATAFVSTSSAFLGGPIPANHLGGAIFTHDGPPGAITADAYFVNGSATVIVPAEFRPVRENSH